LKVAIPIFRPAGFIEIGKITGASKDYFLELGAILGVPVDVKLVPVARMLFLLERKPIISLAPNRANLSSCTTSMVLTIL